MLRIIPNKNNIGAEIETDLQKLSKENFKIIINALNKYGMIFFRRQNLSSKHYVEFAKNFGKLADYPRLKGLNKKYPQITVVQRKESDKVEILSGVFEGKTTGTPIGFAIHNTNQKSKDYSHIQDSYRPSHADYVYDEKYGIRDYRGGGRSSARETASRVVAGAIAKQLLKPISIEAYVSAVGMLSLDTHPSEVN